MKISKQDNVYMLTFENIDIFFDDYEFSSNQTFIHLYLGYKVVSILQDDLVEQFKNIINSKLKHIKTIKI